MQHSASEKVPIPANSYVDGLNSGKRYGTYATAQSVSTMTFKDEFMTDTDYYADEKEKDKYGKVKTDRHKNEAIVIVTNSTSYYNFDVYAFTLSNQKYGFAPVSTMIKNKKYFHKPLYNGLDANNTSTAKMTLEQAKAKYFNVKFDLPDTNSTTFTFSSGNALKGYVGKDDPNNQLKGSIFSEKTYKEASSMKQVSINDLKKMGYEVVENEAQAMALQEKFNALYGTNKITVWEIKNGKTIYHLGVYKIYAVADSSGGDDDDDDDEDEEEDTTVRITFNENNKGGYSSQRTEEYESINSYATFNDAAGYGWGERAYETVYKDAAEYNSNYQYTKFKEQEGTTYKAMNNHYYSYQGWNLYDYATVAASRTTMFGTYNQKYSTGDLTNIFIGYDALVENGYDSYKASPSVVNQTILEAMCDPERTTESKDATVYAIWDGFPTVREEAGLILYKGEISNLKSDADLYAKLKNHLIIRDEEDNANGYAPSVSISNITLKEIQDIMETLDNQQGEIVSYLVTVKDSAGNETIYEADLVLKNNSGDFIGDGGLNLLTMSENYVRFINEDFYTIGIPEGNAKGFDDLLLEYHDLGCLNPRSKWYLYDDYKESIMGAFSNLKNNTPQETWVFQGDVALDVKDYIKANGFAKRKSPTALSNFYDTFKDRAKQ